ncbi:MAG: MBOAT family protein [Clostridiales bacterium]|nr:MBOAT family protein [Clostridiales bacterium]
MSYQSFGFLFFSAAVLLLYYLLGKKLQRWVLAVANLVFYTVAGPQYLPFILVTMLATFFTGKKMGGIYEAAETQLAACTTPAEKKAVKANAKKKAKTALIIGMAVTIALLAVCKYTGFVMRNINQILKLFHAPKLPVFKLILPLGISFYSFMALSYVLDVFWKRYPAETNFLNYAVYLSYFPHVVQGPIDRFNEFNAQIQDGVKFDSKNLVFGSELLLFGLFKKLVIADRLAPFVTHAFGFWKETNGAFLFVAMLAYSVQIYADFSGCIDIVTGVSEMFGIKLRKNFNHPYFSKTMGEFWRRWHISLQEWFKDYVYYPVSASGLMRKAKKHFNQKNKPRAAELFSSCFPILVVWLITGIWHGASWNYIIWGIYHAILLIGSQIFSPLFQKANQRLKINVSSPLWKFWQMTRTFLLCGFGRIFFRANSVTGALGYFGQMFTQFSFKALFTPLYNGLKNVYSYFTSSGSITSFWLKLRPELNRDFGLGITPANIMMALVTILILWCVDMLQEKHSLRESLLRKHIIIRWTIIFAGLFAVIVFGVYGPGYNAKSFIYEQF